MEGLITLVRDPDEMITSTLHRKWASFGRPGELRLADISSGIRLDTKC